MNAPQTSPPAPAPKEGLGGGRWQIAAGAFVLVAAIAALFVRDRIARWVAGGDEAHGAPPVLAAAIVAVDAAARSATLEVSLATAEGMPIDGAAVSVDGTPASPTGKPGRYAAAVALAPDAERDVSITAHAEGYAHLDTAWRLSAGSAGVALAAAEGTAPAGSFAAAPAGASTAPTSGPALPGALPGDDAVDHYTCPMHPSVHAAAPGSCPLCGMPLVAVSKGEVRTGVVRVDPLRLPVLGVRLGVVDRRPVHKHLRAVGRVEYDETRLHDVTLKYGGFVKRLAADATGKTVAKGDLVMTVYSPDVYAAELELIEVARAVGAASPIADAAKRKLALWDLGPRFVEETLARGKPHDAVAIYAPAGGTVVEKSVVAGSAVAASTPLMRIGSLDRVWVLADLYESELADVAAGLAVSVSVRSLPGRFFAGTVSYVYPYLNGMTRTLRLRVELDNTDGLLLPDMLAHVELAVPLGERLVVADSAVVFTGKHRLVFLDLGDGRMLPREVTLGIKVDGGYEVLAGLAAGDRVVESGNFLIASESRLRSAIERRW